MLERDEMKIQSGAAVSITSAAILLLMGMTAATVSGDLMPEGARKLNVSGAAATSDLQPGDLVFHYSPLGHIV